MNSLKESQHREFYKLPTSDDKLLPCEEDKKSELTKYISENVIGKDTTFLSPFGRKRIVY